MVVNLKKELGQGGKAAIVGLIRQGKAGDAMDRNDKPGPRCTDEVDRPMTRLVVIGPFPLLNGASGCNRVKSYYHPKFRVVGYLWVGSLRVGAA